MASFQPSPNAAASSAAASVTPRASARRRASAICFWTIISTALPLVELFVGSASATCPRNGGVAMALQEEGGSSIPSRPSAFRL